MLFGLVVLVNAPAQAADFDHKLFDSLLRSHVSNGHVNYPAFKRSAEFSRYLTLLADAKPDRLSKPQQLAFWLNAYNALAIAGIINGSSPDGFFGRQTYFKSDTYRVAGRRLSLHQVEHDVVLSYGDARVHFALVCASKSCPPLRSEAFKGAKLNRQLEQQTKRFINNAKKNRIDLGKKTAHLSKIFDWFESDFKRSAGSIAAFVARYVADKRAGEALSRGELKIKYLEYDWSLNGTGV